ncbi:hypothetical protein TrVGV298_002783 [Trichoderma virens]|nr:hypothetical protein TrVGV298_002783 [Trichoderma virens]
MSENGEPNVKLEGQNNVAEFDVTMFESGSEGNGFHIKNNPNNPYQRSEVIQRTGDGIDIRCALTEVIHGDMSAESDYWATILVFQFRFDPQQRARRILEATIELQFSASSAENTMPEVDAVSFDGHYSLLPSKQSETTVKGGDGSIGTGYGVDLRVGAKWEKTVVRETTDATTISGGKLVVNNVPPYRVAKWTLLENKTLKTGIPAFIQVAVRVKRLDEAVFQCLPTLRCKADKWTTIKSLFGGLPEDDPVLLKPGMKLTNTNIGYDTGTLGSVDLQKLSNVTFTTVLDNAQ